MNVDSLPDTADDALVPRCDGLAPPESGDSSPHAAVRREFVAVYTRINRLARELSAVRSRPESPERAGVERATLQAMDRVLTERDALEDRQALAGVSATPVVRDGVVVDLQFCLPARPPAKVSSSSLWFTVTPLTRGPGAAP